ncbi:hypothetical protein ACEZ3G_15625 [Maribacter algicola]|uniref:Uncharacterized protein n=1 Tax=Meishania litoralis TaxID=3434685 RepID=A0ACC7LPE9_9FLAO
MMDELELLKKDWQKKEAYLPKLSHAEIHKMIWKKSSSIVKWILIISILEFLLPHLLYLLPSAKTSWAIYESLGMSNYIIGLTVVQYVIVFYFIAQFYKRYKEISVLEDAKKLMRKIIKTRASVKYYIIFSLSLLFFAFVSAAFAIYISEDLSVLFDSMHTEVPQNVSPERLKRSFIWSVLILGFCFTAFIGGIYFLLYGRLLRKLKKNYNELEQIEV